MRCCVATIGGDLLDTVPLDNATQIPGYNNILLRLKIKKYLNSPPITEVSWYSIVEDLDAFWERVPAMLNLTMEDLLFEHTGAEERVGALHYHHGDNQHG